MYSPQYYQLQLHSKPSTPYRTHVQSNTVNDDVDLRSLKSGRTDQSPTASLRSPNASRGSFQRGESFNASPAPGGVASGSGSPYSIEFQRSYFAEQRRQKSSLGARVETREKEFYDSLRLAAEREASFRQKSTPKASTRSPRQVTPSSRTNRTTVLSTNATTVLGASPNQDSFTGRAESRLAKANQEVIHRRVEAQQRGSSRSPHRRAGRLAACSHAAPSPNKQRFTIDTEEEAEKKSGGRLFLNSIQPGELFSFDLSPEEKHIVLASLEFVCDSGIISDGSKFRQIIGWYRADVMKVLDLLSSKFSEWDCIDFGSIEWNIIHNVMTEVRRGRSSESLAVSRAAFFGSISKRQIERIHDRMLNDLAKKRGSGGAPTTTTAAASSVAEVLQVEDAADLSFSRSTVDG